VHNPAFPSALLNEQNLDRPEAELAKITKEKVERSASNAQCQCTVSVTIWIHSQLSRVALRCPHG